MKRRRFRDILGFNYTLNITYITKLRDADRLEKMFIYIEMIDWCNHNLGEENFNLRTEYVSPGVEPEYVISTETEEDLVMFKLKYVDRHV
jgi:hypothetical protein